MTNGPREALFAELLTDQEWWHRRGEYLHLLEGMPECLRGWMTDELGGAVVHHSAEVDASASIDGLVVIGENVKIGPGAVLVGPVYVGSHSIVGPNCYIHHGVYVGERCWLGQGTEVTRSILLEDVRIIHFAYVGYSIVGRRANIAAGVVTTVRRFDNKPVRFRVGNTEEELPHKGGALIGDRAQLGAGVVVLPGRCVSPDAAIPPGIVVRRNVGPDMQQPMDDHDLMVKVWSAILAVWDREADRFWTRNNIFLAVNSALMVFVATFVASPVTAALISACGLAFTFLWARVNIIGKYYLDRWKQVLQKLEHSWDVRPIHEISLLATQHDIPKRYRPSTTYMLWGIRFIRIFWILMLILALVSLLWGLLSDTNEYSSFALLEESGRSQVSWSTTSRNSKKGTGYSSLNCPLVMYEASFLSG